MNRYIKITSCILGSILCFLSISCSPDRVNNSAFDSKTDSSSSSNSEPMVIFGENAYYLDPIDGSDKNDGRSEERPWKTVERLNRKGSYSPGEVIAIKGGTTLSEKLYFSGSGSQKRPITITSYGDKKALIDAGPGNNPQANREDIYDDASSLYLENQSYITIANIQVSNTAYVPKNDEIPNYKRRNGIYVTATKGIVSNIIISDVDVYNVCGTVVRSNFLDNAGINFRYNEYCDENNKFSHILIKNTTITDTYGIGFRIGDMNSSASDANANSCFDNVVLRNVDVLRTGGDGIVLQTCISPIIEDSSVLYAGALSSRFLYYGTDYMYSSSAIAGMWACCTYSPVYRRNEVGFTYRVPTDGQAFDADWGTSGTPVWEYNYTHDNEGGVLLRMSAYKGIFRYNISVNDGNYYDVRDTNKSSVLLHTGELNPLIKETVLFYNNLFYNDANMSDANTDNSFETGNTPTAKRGFRLCCEVDLENLSSYSDPDYVLNDTDAQNFRNNIFVLGAKNQNVDWGVNKYFNNNAYVYLDSNQSFDGLNDLNPLTCSFRKFGFLNPYIDTSDLCGRNKVALFRMSSKSEAIGQGSVIENNGGYDFYGNSLPEGSCNLGPFEVCDD